MFFKPLALSFLVPASLLTLGFFVLFASTKIENKLTNKGIKMYGVFTLSFLWICAIFMLLGEVFETGSAARAPRNEIPDSSLPTPHGEMEIPSSPATPGIPNGDEEMTLNPDENTSESNSRSGQETMRKCPYLRYRDYARTPQRPNKQNSLAEL